MERPTLRGGAAHTASPAHLAAIAMVVALVAWGSFALARDTGRIAAIWPGNALLLTVLLLVRPRGWPARLLAGWMGNAAANILAGDPIGLGLGLALCNTAEVALAATLLRQRSGRLLNLARLHDLARFGLVATVLAPLVSGLLAAGLLAAARGVEPQHSLRLWAMADALGMALVLPLTFSLLRGTNPGRPRPGLWDMWTLLLLGGTAVVVFAWSGLSLLFLVSAPLLLVVWRLGTLGAALGVALVGIIGLLALIAGEGPFQQLADLQPTYEDQALLLQVFLLFLSMVSLPVAALLTTRHRLDKALRDSEAESKRQAGLLQVVLAAMEQGLAAFDRNGRLIVANQRYREELLLPQAMLAPGTRFFTITRFLAARGDFGPGDPDALARQRLENALRSGPQRFVRASRDNRMLEITRRPLPNGGFVNTYSDITEQVRREQRLAESEASFRLLAEHSGDVVTRLGLDGVRHYVSPVALRVLHWPPEALVGHRAQEFVYPEDRSWVESTLQALAAGETEEATVTYRFLRPDGSHGWVESHARLVRHALTQEPTEVIATLRDATDRKAAEEQLLGAFEQMEAMALTDPLTGLANRRHFDEALLREWRRAAREGTALSLLLLDVDRFKAYNDRYGHGTGDTCLVHLAAALEGAARRPADLAARFGGEEFAMVLPGTDEEGAAEVAERLRAAVQAAGLPHLGNPPLTVVTISAGTVTVRPRPEDAIALDALIRAADGALYAAKDGGRNRVCQAAPQAGAHATAD